jgi:hypothetical protein
MKQLTQLDVVEGITRWLMNAKQLKEIVDNLNISSCESMKQSIRKRLETAAYNSFYHIIFDHRSYDGPFLLPERVRKVFLEDLTKDGFVVECETRWWKTKTIKISWLVPLDLEPRPLPLSEHTGIT